MAVQVTPITPGLPATTAIQDPAVRQFANAVADILRTSQTTEGAIAQLERAAGALSKGSGSAAPPAISQWLYSSELYQRLSGAIERVDTSAQEAIVAEALARAQAITAALANVSQTPAYDAAETYAAGDLATYESGLYRALQETTGNAPTSATHWEKVGDYASLGEAVAAHALQLTDHETRVTSAEDAITAEAEARTLLATQVGANAAAIQAEATARADADGALAEQITTVASETGVNAAAIVTEAETRTTNDLAIVQALDTLWSISGASKALSQDGKNLITNWQTATAQEWQTLQAEVLDAGGNTLYAAVAAESQARADLEGKVAASWMVKAEVDVGTGKPYVAGIALGAEGQGGSATSEFLVRADRFAMVMPGYGEYVPFAIGDFGPEFSGLTSWSNVQGVGKPADGADVTRLNTAAAIAGQGAFATLSKINASNVTTYIDNAALGNAQIGGNLWSTNWSGWGGTGWLLDRSGNFYGNNIYARGDIEATSIKAGAANIVNTINVAGNAITVPVSAEGTSSCQTATANFGGAPVALVVTGIGRHSHGSIGGGYINKYLRVYRNGGLIKTIQTSNYYYGGSGETETWNSSGAWVITDYPGPGSFYYTVSVDDGTSCSVLAIGVKR